MTIHNIFNTGSQRINFVVKRQEYVKYDFTTDVNPCILAYQALGWWFPRVTSRNRANYDGLCDISWGVMYHRGEIEIEVYGVTRERLLQGSSTNYKTYDFETSQNLFLTTLDRDPDSYTIDQSLWANGKIGFDRTRWNGTPFDPDQDFYTREEIAQRTKKTVDIHFTPLTNNYVWRVHKSADMMTRVDTAQNTTINIAGIPGPQGNNPYGINANRTTQNSELLQRTGDIQYNQAMMWNRATYPIKMLHPPNIQDETGTMKWIYEVRMSTKLHCTFMVWPDYTDNYVDDMLARQQWEIPYTTSINPLGTTTCTLTANAFEVKM